MIRSLIPKPWSILALASLCIAFCTAVRAQPERRFDHLTMDDGLSESIVLSILQDRQGFMWFGTADGLNRFDGYSFKVFHSDVSDSATLPNNYVQSLYQDRSGNVWVGSLGGLALYDPVHESFRRMRLDEGGSPVVGVFGIAESPADSSLWLNTDGGLLQLSRRRSAEGGSAEYFVARRFKPDSGDPRGLQGANATGLAFDRDGSLWVGTRDHGLSVLDPARGTFRHFTHMKDDERSLSGNFVQMIFLDRQGTIWVGTEGAGLNRFDRRSGNFWRYASDPGRPGSIGHNVIRSIIQDRRGEIWVGTDGGGLDRYDPVADAFVQMRHDASRASSLANDRVTALYEDRAGALWVGTWGNGVDRWSPSKEKFSMSKNLLPLARGLANPFVISLFEDSRGMMWAGTHGGGAIGHHPATGATERCAPGAGAGGGLADGAVWSVREDRDGDLWFATNSGVDRYDVRSRKYTHYAERGPEKQGLGTRFAGRAEPDGDYVWVTTDKSLDRINRVTGAVENYPYALALGDRTQGYIAGFLREGDLILLGTTPILAFDTRTLAYVPTAASAGNVPVSCLVADSKGNLWIGTFGQGVYLLDRSRAVTRHLTQENGLPNNVVYGILEDAQGRCWMSTNKGIAEYDPAAETFRNFDVTDGLQSNEFNRGAYWKGRDGTLYFGGINGFNAFHPDSIRGNPYPPPVVFTSFKRFNDPLPLPEAPASVREIFLAHDENFFSFEFAALDFTEPSKNRYAYMLEGLDREWVASGTRTFAGYTNLDPGSYTLKVKGSNNDGLWNEDGASVRVTIAPPWWRTTWAYGLYLVALVAGSAGVRWLVQNWSIILASRKARYVAHYKVLDLLGEGGMGKVFRASDMRTKEVVALKVLSRELLRDPENRRRFTSEGRLLSSFRHPHIVRVLEVGETEERGYIAMEYLPGGTLKERLAAAFPFPASEVKRIALQIAAGLEEIHARGVIHRDIKTGNIMSDGDGNIRIMDFGLSKSPLVTTMTTMGTVIGTLGYVAPEQVTNMNVDHRVDIFSFGVLLYELLTNRLPFGGENEIAVIHSLFNTIPRPPSLLQPGFPPALDPIVMRCLEKDSAARFATVAELRVALEGGFW